MKQIPIIYKKNGKIVYVQDSDDTHHVIVHRIRDYWKLRKTIPEKCIVHETIKELKEALKIV